MLKEYKNKSIELSLVQASNDFDCEISEINYIVKEEIKKLFKKEITISCYVQKSVIEYVDDFLNQLISNLGINGEVVTYTKGKIIYSNINTENNSILIGKNGVALKSIETIVKQAVSNSFKKRFDITIDVNGYKDDRIKKAAGNAKRLAKQVLKTKIDIKLDPMPADERKMMHKVLSKMDHIKTKSYGEGDNRYMIISYSLKK